MTKVVELFSATPKSLKRQFKNIQYTLIYLPETKEWKWEVDFVSKIHLTGTASTMRKAENAVQDAIKRRLEILG